MVRYPISSDDGHLRINPAGLLAALDLMELGFEMMRQKIRLQSPDASSREVGERLQSWIGRAPGKLAVDSDE
jgi:hypothetical protein